MSLSDTDQQAIADLLDFWFAEEARARWYDSTPAFDDLCRQRFGRLAAQAADGELSNWERSANGSLALCLLLDQMPRNLFRGTPKAFANDPKALTVANHAIEQGQDQELDIERRNFLYLPFMHSEDLSQQRRSIELSKSLGKAETLKYAEEHAEIIERFGRFPHRNTILGRTSTPEEQAFLTGSAKTYGQTRADD